MTTLASALLGLLSFLASLAVAAAVLAWVALTRLRGRLDDLEEWMVGLNRDVNEARVALGQSRDPEIERRGG